MSRTIVTNSGSRFLTSISSERLIGLLSKEVGGQYSEDFDGPVMAYDMSSDGVKDLAYKLTHFLSRERYFRFFEKHKHFFSEGATIYTFVSFVEDLIKNLKDSEGYNCL
jgi:hypothetical protein